MGELVAGRELDALIAEKVMGWHRVERKSDAGSDNWYSEANGIEFSIDDTSEADGWYPSTDIADAWTLLETIAEWPFILETRYVPFRWHAKFRHGEAEADTAPLAICRAALAAVAH